MHVYNITPCHKRMLIFYFVALCLGLGSHFALAQAALLSKPTASETHPKPTHSKLVQTIKVSINVQDADLPQLLDAVESATDQPKKIEVRHAVMDYKISIKATNISYEDLLRGIAGFAHCQLYVLPDRFLICPPSRLRSEEQKAINQTNYSNEAVIYGNL